MLEAPEGQLLVSTGRASANQCARDDCRDKNIQAIPAPLVNQNQSIRGPGMPLTVRCMHGCPGFIKRVGVWPFPFPCQFM